MANNLDSERALAPFSLSIPWGSHQDLIVWLLNLRANLK
jgi:hypothetical protein